MEKRKVLNQGFTKRMTLEEFQFRQHKMTMEANLNRKREELDREIHYRLVDLINDNFDAGIEYEDYKLLLDTRSELYEQGIEFQVNEGWQGETYVVQIAITQVATTIEINFEKGID